MKSYYIDEISEKDMKTVGEYLKTEGFSSSLEKIFWIPLPDGLLSPQQSEHKQCQPHVFALELGKGWIKAEMFVRSLKNMRCTCPGYCEEGQRGYVIFFVENLIGRLGIGT